MKKVIIGIIGIILFLFGIVTFFNISKEESQALSLDSEKEIFAMMDENSPPPCSWEVKPPERVMAEDKSQAIVIQTTNSEKKQCESFLTLRAPGFELSPPKEEQAIKLPAKGKGSLSWILTPHRAGTFEIAVSDIINTKVLGITVTNIFGLTAIQAKFSSILFSLFGPMLTVPWWWDKLRQRKQKQELQKDG